MIDFVLGRVEEHVGADGSRFSESFLERLALCNCFTVECGQSWNVEVDVLLDEFTIELNCSC